MTEKKRINPDMKYSALERLDIKFTELIGAIEEKQVDGQLSSKDHSDYELVCYCRGFIKAELEKERRTTHTSATAPEPDEKHLRCDHIKEDCPDMCIHRQFHSIRQCHGLCPIERGRQQCSPDDYVRSRPHPSAQTPAGYTGEDIFGPFIHEHNLKVAKAAREQFAKELLYNIYGETGFYVFPHPKATAGNGLSRFILLDELTALVESLRAQQHQTTSSRKEA